MVDSSGIIVTDVLARTNGTGSEEKSITIP